MVGGRVEETRNNRHDLKTGVYDRHIKSSLNTDWIRGLSSPVALPRTRDTINLPPPGRAVVLSSAGQDAAWKR
jgi:hypothetical protein